MIAQYNYTNIRSSQFFTWKGQSGSRKGFCVFSAPAYCYRASFIIMMRYRERGIVSYEGILSTWCPPSENNTAKYVKDVLSSVFGHGWPLARLKRPQSEQDYARLIAAMCKYETGVCVSSSEVYDALMRFMCSIPFTPTEQRARSDVEDKKLT